MDAAGNDSMAFNIIRHSHNSSFGGRYRYSWWMINGRYCCSVIPVSYVDRNRYASRLQLASSLIMFTAPVSRVRKRRLNSIRYDSYELVVNHFLTITYGFLHKDRYQEIRPICLVHSVFYKHYTEDAISTN